MFAMTSNIPPPERTNFSTPASPSNGSSKCLAIACGVVIFTPLLCAMIHEYFHLTQNARLGRVTGKGPPWLVEGSAELEAYRVMANLGQAHLDQIRSDRIIQTRGLLNPLSSLELLGGLQRRTRVHPSRDSVPTRKHSCYGAAASLAGIFQ
jgi:hypothetical protein